MIAWGSCEQCGTPATTLARDVFVRPDGPGGFWAAYDMSQTLRRGCAAHPAVSLMLDEDGKVLTEALSEA